jgi:hypothetical protein
LGGNTKDVNRILLGNEKLILTFAGSNVHNIHMPPALKRGGDRKFLLQYEPAVHTEVRMFDFHTTTLS